MKGSPVFRSLRAADAAQCARLHAQAFAPSWSRDDFADQSMRADRILTGGVLAEPILCGFAVSRFIGDEADLLTIVVDRGTQGRGIGAGLLGHHLSVLGAARVKHVFLEVGAGNAAALALYARFGFVSVGARKSYYGAGARGCEDAVVLKCDL